MIEGGSAGGLLMGAVAEPAARPVQAPSSPQVPFVDVINTMLDESLPLTVGEFEEWGNPQDQAEQYEYMKTYSPYDNLRAEAYPAMLVTTSLNDSQVMYWEPAKWVAKLRALKTDRNPLLFKINMDGRPRRRLGPLRRAAARSPWTTPSCWSAGRGMSCHAGGRRHPVTAHWVPACAGRQPFNRPCCADAAARRYAGTPASACSRSAIRSSGSSTPIEMRISAGRDREALQIGSAAMPECVVDAGCEASVSVPPRLTASLITSSRSSRREGGRFAAPAPRTRTSSRRSVLPLVQRRDRDDRSGRKSRYQTLSIFG